MAKTDVRGKVQTVLGLINGSQLGVTLPHEHFFIDSRCYMIESTNPEKRS
jgi:predicted metal-dependent phosphotriesterase family hydrolase